MKKNTVKLFILAAMLGGSLSALAQSKPARVVVDAADARRLSELSEKLTAEYKANYAEAVAYAEANNIPLVIKKENGSTSVLTKVEDGELFYTTTSNVGSAKTSRTNHLQPGGSLNLNLTGEFDNGDHMLVGVWDNGYARLMHNDLVGRTTTGDSEGQDALHSTHVTGTIIGDGSSAADSKGMASKAHAINYTFGNDAGEMAVFALIGNILSNHSYGIDPDQFTEAYMAQYRGTYDSYAREADLITFDAPYYQPVYAAGNDGDGFTYDRLTDRSLSKNGIAVAAVSEVDTYTDSFSVQVTGFSSFGPSNDNRIKPDIATKGLDVFSCSNSGNSAHSSLQGTSMAAPGITGSLALLQQYYSILHPGEAGARNFMRSSTVRALVAHSADEAGLTDGPDAIYGWGLMNSKRAAEILAADDAGTSAKIQELVLLPGATNTFTYTVNASGTEPLVATLAWTDPAAAAAANGSAASALVNNLDIKVTKGSTVYYPWKLYKDGDLYLASNNSVNNVDNIEKVEVPNASGAYTITVSHQKTTLVNPNGTPQQAFSLIVTGISDVPAGLEDNEAKMFSVWPNPASDVLNISFANGIENGAAATIYDIQGRVVRKAALTNVDNVIEVQGLAKGIYVVSVTNGDKTEIEKVVIK